MGKVLINDKFKPSVFSDVSIEKIIDSIDEAVAGCDHNGIMNFYNSASELREGVSRKQVLNRHVDDIYDFHGDKSLLMRAIHEKKPILDQYQEYMVKGSGKLMEIICSTVPIKSGENIIGAVSVMKDYSRLKKISKLITDLQSTGINQGNATVSGKSRGPSAKFRFSDIIGQNAHFLDVLDLARKTADNNMPVLIYGETGTGKELIAQSIHNASLRKNHPFIAINCAAIPENLLESLLFGTTKGAFTGAVDRPGLFEQATGGTLVLDEINSMPLSLQPKLLRVVQEEAIRRVGNAAEKKVDVRLISISNKDPLLAIKNNQLREDLYYRIAYISVNVPPLRNRLDDIPILVDSLINKLNANLNYKIKHVSEEFLQILSDYHWPGNIRELEHVLATGMSINNNKKTEIGYNDLPPNVQYKFSLAKSNKNNRYIKIPLDRKLKLIEKVTIEKALKRNSGNVSKTARELGLKRQSLQHKIKKYSLSTAHNSINL